MDKHLSRRGFLAGAAAGLAGVFLAACQPKVVEVEKVVEKQVTQVIKETVMVAGTPQVVEKVVTATPLPPTPKPVDKGPLRMLWNASWTKFLDDFNPRFIQKHPGVSVEVISSTEAELSQKMLSLIAAGDPPDLFYVVNYLAFAQYVHSSVCLPLDDLVARDKYNLDEYIPNTVDAGRIKGKLYSIPYGGHPSSYFLFYNKTALGAKGIKLDNKAWKWSDYMQVVRAMADPSKKVFGSWLRANTEGFLVGLRSVGTDVFDATGTKCLVNTPEARPFFDMAYKLIAEEKVTMPSNQGDWKAPFAAGNIMMANDNGYRESWLREMVKDFEWDTFVTPNEGKTPRGVFVCNLAPITSVSKHIDLAWEWIKQFNEVEEGINRVKKFQFIPLTKPDALLPKNETISPQYEFYIKEWLANPPLPMPQPANARTSEVYDILQKGFDQAWLGTKSLDETLKSVNDAMQAVLNKPAV